MSKKKEKPSAELYDSLQTAYEHFNKHLFKGSLPAVLFTVQRQAGTLGYFIPNRWSSPEGELCHEIAINPTHIGSARVIEVLQTLVHEMVHCWQYNNGSSPSKGYHNKEWAYKMIEIGLHPSSTGKPGGEIVGMQMSDYVIDGGPFWEQSVELIKNERFRLPWICRLSNTRPFSIATEQVTPDLVRPVPASPSPLVVPESVKITETSPPTDFLFSSYQDLMPANTFFSPAPRGKAKSKYHCSGCNLNAWAKPGVRLKCADCDILLEEAE